MITREEYLEKMQSLREKQHENARQNRELFDKLEDEYRQKKTQLFMEYEARRRQLKEKKSLTQNHIEQQMHELKVQWAIGHPVEEVKVVNND